MTLDSEEQRKILLTLIAAASFPGDVVEVVYELKQALAGADIKTDADDKL